MRVIFLTTLALLLSACANVPHGQQALEPCQSDRPDKLALREAMLAQDAATAWTLDAHEEGIGASVTRQSERTTLVKFMPGGPALMSQLRESDVLTCVAPDGKAPFYDVSSLSLDDVVSLLRGEPGSPVVLRVLRNGTTTDISLNRKRVRLGD